MTVEAPTAFETPAEVSAEQSTTGRTTGRFAPGVGAWADTSSEDAAAIIDVNATFKTGRMLKKLLHDKSFRNE